MIFKVGDRVICQSLVDGNERVINKHGKIIGVAKAHPSICVEFDEDISGHDGNYRRNKDTGKIIEGKSHHCWYVYEEVIILENKNRRINKQ